MTEHTTDAYDYPDSDSLLTAARSALGSGQARLAIRLYYAAFELGASSSDDVSDELIGGLRIAWNLACELGDRSTAESLLNELEPFSTQEEKDVNLTRLQSLQPSPVAAFGQLPDLRPMGMNIESLGQALASREGFDLNEWLKTLRNLLGNGEEAAPDGDGTPGEAAPSGRPLPEGRPTSGNEGVPDIPSPESGAALMTFPAANPASLPVPSRPDRLDGPPRRRDRAGGEGNDDVDLRRPAWRMDYNHIIGYRHAMEQMRNFGFFRRDEHELHRFAEWVSNLHGVAKLSLSKPFLFSGPEISDVNFFAHATANEIGFPVVSIHIDIDERGNGAIRIFGPFRQRFFSGPPDLNELQTPCTVLLEDIGALQQIFQADQQAAMREQRNPQFAWEPGNRRSVQLEFGGYLRELINKPGVIFMATCEEGYVPDESLADITSAMRQIEVGYPTPDERRAIWERLKIDHASLQGIETEKLVGFSGNIARTAMFEATQVALDGAYQSSLSSGQYQPVQLTDILTSLSAYLDRDTEAYTRLEDAIVAEFMSDLDNSADL